MGRIETNLSYLKEIDVIRDFLKNSAIEEQSLKRYLIRLDRLFPYFLSYFKKELKIENFKLEEYENYSTEQKNTLKNGWKKSKIGNKVFLLWKELSSNNKANMLMKYIQEIMKIDENKVKKGNKKKQADKNNYLNIIWMVQGFFAKLGNEYVANATNMDVLSQENLHLIADIEFEDVEQLFDKIGSRKYKLILKLMMFTGLNPVDIANLTVNDFKKFKFTEENGKELVFHYLYKKRKKSADKDVYYLILFPIEFFNEIKAYFETTELIHLKKDVDNKTIEELRKDQHFSKKREGGTFIEFAKNNIWDNDKKEKLFGNITADTISEQIKYHVDKHNLNKNIMPQQIRRLCFTRLQSIFPMMDLNLFQLWTQHKLGFMDTYYITGYINRIIKDYILNNKIQDRVLLENSAEYRKKYESVKDQKDRIDKLEDEKRDMKQRLENLEQELDVKVKAIKEMFNEFIIPKISVKTIEVKGKKLSIDEYYDTYLNNA